MDDSRAHDPPTRGRSSWWILPVVGLIGLAWRSWVLRRHVLASTVAPTTTADRASASDPIDIGRRTAPDWSSAVVAAVDKESAHARSDEPQVHSLTATSPDDVEIVFSHSWGPPGRRGIRLHRDHVRAAGWLGEIPADHLAFYIVHTGIREPRRLDEFSPPDADGVRWLDVPQWLAEITG